MERVCWLFLAPASLRSTGWLFYLCGDRSLYSSCLNMWQQGWRHATDSPLPSNLSPVFVVVTVWVKAHRKWTFFNCRSFGWSGDCWEHIWQQPDNQTLTYQRLSQSSALLMVIWICKWVCRLPLTGTTCACVKSCWAKQLVLTVRSTAHVL